MRVGKLRTAVTDFDDAIFVSSEAVQATVSASANIITISENIDQQPLETRRKGKERTTTLGSSLG